MAGAADVPEFCRSDSAIHGRIARPGGAASLNKAPTSIVNSALKLWRVLHTLLHANAFLSPSA